jgi:hypothetical protein
MEFTGIIDAIEAGQFGDFDSNFFIILNIEVSFQQHTIQESRILLQDFRSRFQ